MLIPIFVGGTVKHRLRHLAVIYQLFVIGVADIKFACTLRAYVSLLEHELRNGVCVHAALTHDLCSAFGGARFAGPTASLL